MASRRAALSTLRGCPELQGCLCGCPWGLPSAVRVSKATLLCLPRQDGQRFRETCSAAVQRVAPGLSSLKCDIPGRGRFENKLTWGSGLLHIRGASVGSQTLVVHADQSQDRPRLLGTAAWPPSSASRDTGGRPGPIPKANAQGRQCHPGHRDGPSAKSSGAPKRVGSAHCPGQPCPGLEGGGRDGF